MSDIAEIINKVDTLQPLTQDEYIQLSAIAFSPIIPALIFFPHLFNMKPIKGFENLQS